MHPFEVWQVLLEAGMATIVGAMGLGYRNVSAGGGAGGQDGHG
jgi:hypothetical protein